ncbi:hypothetical protein DWB68_15290 [Galactobacter valiniphilus]|uniref:DNA-binding protein n=1 Tax=Galactobacter valiniphilus TaxID=2676122 RepID=A0A399J708_9MICC|nr:hypothetical protein [Galactobacter valiniphilus]RII40930.1 hypothetical protein DWB68_15290 [Galactobacter valiniphilus]
MSDLPRYRTPAHVAAELGIPVTTVKRHARVSGICTRLERRRIAFTAEQIEELAAWIEGQQSPTFENVPAELDAFA